jgi:hypothetical protein
MLPSGVGEHAGGIVVNHFDVGHQGSAGVESFEEVVRQQRILRDASVERGGEGVHVVQALAGENALGEQILVNVGNGGGIRVHTRMASVGTGE